MAYRILYLIDQMQALTAGGTERQILQMAKMVKESGNSAELCVLRGTEWLTEEIADVPVHFAGLHRFSRPSGWRAFLALASWMRSNKFDILQTFFVESNLVGPLLSRMAGIPVVLGSRRNLNYWMGPKTATLERISNKFATRLVANCEAVKQVLVEHQMAPPSKIDVLYNGVDLDFFVPDAQERSRLRRELKVSDSELLVGNISAVRTIKGTEFFVAAAVILCKELPEVKFVLVGDGPLLPELRAVIDREGLADRFLFAGSQTDVRRYLRAFDIAVLSSESEGFSNSILEYISMGLPCVVTNVGGNAEALGGGGILVPPRDPAAIAAALRTLVSDPGLRADYAAKAFAHSRRFSLSSARSGLDRYYKNLLQ